MSAAVEPGQRDLAALTRYFIEMAAAPYTEPGGGNDCVLFADGAIRAQTGKSRLGRLTWKDAAAAARTLKRLGGMEAAVTGRLGAPVPPAHAHRGDIAGVPDGRFGLLLMVVEGATLIGPGNTRAARSRMTVAWRGA